MSCSSAADTVESTGPCNRKRCRLHIEHLQEDVAKAGGRVSKFEKLNSVRKRVLKWKWLCSPSCTRSYAYDSTPPPPFAESGEHVSVAVKRAGLKDAVEPLYGELLKVYGGRSKLYGGRLLMRAAFLQNGMYETQRKKSHIIAIGFSLSWEKEHCGGVEFAPMHYDTRKKAWVDLEEEEWTTFVRFSSYGTRLVRIQPNPYTREDDVSYLFQITEYEVFNDGTLDVIRAWKKFDLWKIKR